MSEDEAHKALLKYITEERIDMPEAVPSRTQSEPDTVADDEGEEAMRLATIKKGFYTGSST